MLLVCTTTTIISSTITTTPLLLPQRLYVDDRNVFFICRYVAQIFVCGKKSWIGSAVHFNVQIGVGRVCLVGVRSLYRLRTVPFGV